MTYAVIITILFWVLVEYQLAEHHGQTKWSIINWILILPEFIRDFIYQLLMWLTEEVNLQPPIWALLHTGYVHGITQSICGIFLH